LTSDLTSERTLDIDPAGKYALLNMKKIQAIIFDWGGVLIEDPAPGVVRYCVKTLGVSEEDYKRAWNLYMNDFQTGLVTEQQFWKNMTNHLKAPMPKANSLWGDAFAAAYIPRRELFVLAARLRKAGCKIAILSNTEKPAVELFHKQKYDMFDVEVFSCLEGTKKPERKIYELTLDRIGTTAGQTLFIDDKQNNIDGAKQAGLETILFRDVDQLKKDLAGFTP
jgi:putative hydrolase of the HAD superfamily